MTGPRGVLRGAPWPPLLSMSVGGGIVLGVAAAVPPSWAATRLIGVGFALLAAAAAWALDEPAAAVVDATPASLAARNLVRSALVVGPLAVAGVGLTLMWLRDPSTPLWRLGLQAVGVVVLTVAAAAAARRSRATPGEAVGSTAALVVVALDVADPFSRWLPVLPLTSGENWARTCAGWTVAIAVAAVVFARAGRDRLAA